MAASFGHPLEPVFNVKPTLTLLLLLTGAKPPSCNPDFTSSQLVQLYSPPLQPIFIVKPTLIILLLLMEPKPPPYSPNSA